MISVCRCVVLVTSHEVALGYCPAMHEDVAVTHSCVTFPLKVQPDYVLLERLRLESSHP